jgi:integrase
VRLLKNACHDWVLPDDSGTLKLVPFQHFHGNCLSFYPLLPEMPQRAAQSEWVVSLRSGIKASCGTGWLVSNDHGRMRLEVHDPAVGKKQAVLLPYRWHQDDWVNGLARVRQVNAAYVTGGLSLKAAAEVGEKTSSFHVDDWQDACSRFKAYKVPDHVTEKTFTTKYLPVLSPALALLGGRSAPQDGKQLCEAVLEPWKGKDTMHRHMWQALTQFLHYCVDDLGFKPVWRPPAKRLKRAKKTSADGSKRKAKVRGYALTDADILQLLDSLPDDEAGQRWRFAFQLMAVYGLRPEDLRYLTTRREGEELWSEYEKSKGGTEGDCTEERKLLPLLVHDVDGPVNWHLRQRFHTRMEKLPPLGPVGHAGEACGTYLRRQPVWKSLRLKAQGEGQKLVPYSFRHRYSYVAHTRPKADGTPRPVKEIADAMGHDLATHLHSYTGFKARDLESSFDDDSVATPAATSGRNATSPAKAQ